MSQQNNVYYGSLTPANFTGVPNRFPDPFGKVAGHGCAGVKENAFGAAGEYVPMFKQNGGSGGVCLAKDPLSQHITGPKAGHAAVKPCASPNNPIRTLGFGAGQAHANEVGQNAVINPLLHPLKGGRRTRRRRGGLNPSHHGKLNPGNKSMSFLNKVEYYTGADFPEFEKRRKASKKKKSLKKKSLKKKTLKRKFKKQKRLRKNTRRMKGGAYNPRSVSNVLAASPHSPPAFGTYGNGQPYSNVPSSFGYSTGDSQLSPSLSGLANPPPQNPYYTCQTGAGKKTNKRGGKINGRVGWIGKSR